MAAMYTATALALLVETLARPPYPGFGQPFSISPQKLSAGVVFVRPGQMAGEVLPTPMDCRMPMVRANGNVDPKIVREPPKDIDFKIRAIEVPPCK